jgi:PKD domain/Carboxypeptidase regulatory-like domain
MSRRNYTPTRPALDRRLLHEPTHGGNPSDSSEKNRRILRTGQFAAIASVFIIALLVASSLFGMFAPAPTKARTAANDAWIVGYVTDGVMPIENACMLYILSMGGGSPLGMALSDATGYYNLTVSGGVGYMVIGMNGGYYTVAGSASPYAGQESWLNLTMSSIDPLVADVVLTGYVLDGSGNPVPGGGVLGYVNDPANGGEGMPIYGNLTYPDPSNGSYSVNVIPGSAGGGIGALGFVGYGFVDNTTLEPFESGHTYWINLTLSTPPSTDDAVLSGSVTDASSGDPIPGASVSIETRNEWMSKSYTNLTFTDAAGVYEMNVTNGTARVTVQAAYYSIFMTDNFQIDTGSHVIVDATLLATNATVSGNVTNAGTGSPLAGVTVIVTDGARHYCATTTNATGGYEMAVFVSSPEQIWTQYSGYSSNMTYIVIQPGEHLWVDFQISPLDAWLTGKVTDAILGTPIADAEVRVHSFTGDLSTRTNSTGDYNLTLQSGNVSIEANANNYNNYNYGPLEITPGANSFDIALMPGSLPLTTRMYGWVNDSDSGTGIPNANVQVGLAPPNYGQTTSNSTDGTGYYEIWVPPTLLLFVATAQDHTHAEGFVNATGQAEVRVDVTLVPDLWSPNITMLQSPTENISVPNPSSIDVTVQETDPQQLMLIFFMYVNSSSGTSDYMVVQAFSHDFNPLNQGTSSLPFSQAGDEYNVSMIWYTSGIGGMLTSGSVEQYFGAFEMPMGPDVYLGVRARYYNETLGSSEQGVAWFDNNTGEFKFFSFDVGPMEFAYASDPTGMVIPLVSVLRVNDTNNMTMWYDNFEMGNWSVVGLSFVKNDILPSGRYISVFAVSDFGGRGNGTMMSVTVDNDPPVANAGPDQVVALGEKVYFDSTGSSDNVGITNYTWYFDDGATHIVLWGPDPDFTFLAEGVYYVTLEVRDGANHTSTDIVQITVTTVIPEYTTAVIPIVGMVLIVAVTRARRSRQDL